MSHYLVFGGRKWKNVMGQQGITWEIAGVFNATDEEEACLVAAQKQGVGTCFAVPGYAWGVDTIDAGDVPELGAPVDPMTRLERLGRNLEKSITAAIESGQERQLEAGDQWHAMK